MFLYFNVITLYNMNRKIERRKYTTITIPTKLFDKLSEKIKDTGFSSVSDYVTYILREILVEMDSPDDKKDEIIEKLRKLGYI